MIGVFELKENLRKEVKATATPSATPGGLQGPGTKGEA